MLCKVCKVLKFRELKNGNRSISYIFYKNISKKNIESWVTHKTVWQIKSLGENKLISSHKEYYYFAALVSSKTSKFPNILV